MGKPRILKLRPEHQRPPAWVAGLEGQYVGMDAVDPGLVVHGHEDADVLLPGGALLARYRANVLPPDLLDRAWDALLRAAKETDTRGAAAGGQWYVRRKADGTASKVRRGRKVLSGVMGTMDAGGHHKHCRLTAYTAQDVAGWADVQPLIRAVAEQFRALVPDRAAAQQAAADACDPHWIIPGTPFSTVTVNLNFQTAVHRDEGDYAPGLGVMCVLRRGDYTGGLTVWPEFGVGVDLQPGGLLVGDVHRWHCNAPIVGEPGSYKRVSLVFYLRAGMLRCGTPEFEAARAGL